MTPDPMLALVERFTHAAAEGQAKEQESRLVYPVNAGAPWTEVVIALSGVVSTGKRVNLSGCEVYYRREGSVPGGRLLIDIGGTVRAFYPGMRIRAQFDGFIVTLDPRSATVGNACLVVSHRPGLSLEEPPYEEIPGSPFEPVFLLGSENLGAKSVSYVAVNMDEEPTGTAWAGAFHTQGFSRLRVLIDNTGVAGTLTSFRVIPWIQWPGVLRDDATQGEKMFEDGSAVIDIPDSLSTDEKRRVFLIDITPGDYVMALEFAGNGGDSETVNVAVQGIR
jgi:hypothetical protein